MTQKTEVVSSQLFNHEKLESSSGTDFAPPAEPWKLFNSRQRTVFLAVLFLVTMSNYFDFYIVSVVLDPIKREFKVSDSMLGMLSGFCFAFVYAVAGLPIARMADRGNRRTIITIALAGWSLMTAVCGMAQTFAQLLLARMAVGLAEPGATPPAQSLIADYFPPSQRALALTVVTQWGAGAGGLLGVGLGGYIAATMGWRAAFLLAGLPGLALALIVRITLREPRGKLGFQNTYSSGESLSGTFLHLLDKRSFRFLLIGTSVLTLFCSSTAAFMPSFMIRSMHATLAEVSLIWGVVVTIAASVGALVGGYLVGRLGVQDIRWYAWLPAASCILGVPTYFVALSTHERLPFILVACIAEATLGAGIAVVFPAVHVVCGRSRRATAVAVLYFCFMFFGSGFGPLLTGMISDRLAGAYGPESLRYALIMMLISLVPAAVAFNQASRSISADQEA